MQKFIVYRKTRVVLHVRFNYTVYLHHMCCKHTHTHT